MATATSTLETFGQADGRAVRIEVAPGSVLDGDLIVPSEASARGAVLVTHASRAPRRDARNRVVVAALRRAGLTTLLLDVFTQYGKVGHPPVGDFELLAQRIAAATHWLHEQSETASLTLGYLGTMGGAAPALLAAAVHPEDVGAVVCWGVDGELAELPLEGVLAPVLLIVDGHPEDLERAYQLRRRCKCETRVAIIPGATHAFDQFGPVQRAARLTTRWFEHHLSRPASVTPPA